MTRAPRVSVFAVEATSVQLCWGGLGPGTVTARSGPARRSVENPGGPGALTLEGLTPGRLHRIRVTAGSDEAGMELEARTLEAPPGPELYRFATLNDLHIGIPSFGLRGRIREEPAPAEPHPVRCVRAALIEASRWGAQHLFLKGDLTNQGRRAEWLRLGELIGEARLSHDAVPGNHDVCEGDHTIDLEEGAASASLRLHRSPGRRDLPGLRVVLLDSTIPGHHRGTVRRGRMGALEEVLADADRPVLLATHHHLQRFRAPTFWPPGIPGPEASELLERVSRIVPDALVTSGHTHRHRRFRHGSLSVVEVGAPTDHPGTWTGYVVHEGGVRQVTRRIEEPDVIAWTERTARAALGLWGRWSPGRLEDRCFVHRWRRAA